MRSRLCVTTAHTSALAYTWYLAKAADHTASAGSPRSVRLSIYGRVSANIDRTKANGDKATSGYNKVLWRAQLPARGVILLLVSLGFCFFLQWALISVLNGLGGYSLWAYVQSYPTSPMLVFSYVLVVHLALRGSFGFFKRSSSAGSVTPNVARYVRTILRSPLRLFRLSTAVLVLLGWAGFNLCGLCKTSQPKGFWPNIHSGESSLATSLQSLQQSFVRSASSQNGQISRLPALAFKLSDPAFLAHPDCPKAPEASAAYVPCQGAGHILANTLSRATILRTHALGGATVGLSWPSLPFQMLHRTAAVRVLVSAWHVFGDTLGEGATSFNVSPASGVSPYSNGVAVIPVYVRPAERRGRGALILPSLDLSRVSPADVLETLAPGLAFRTHRLHRSLVMAYARPDALETLAPRLSFRAQRLHRSLVTALAESPLSATEAKTETPSCEAAWGVGLAVNHNAPQLRSSAKLGTDVGFSTVQTAACSVKTKPWRRV